MVKDLVPVEVDVNSADAAFWRRYHAFRRAYNAETSPDDPILPDAVEERRMKLPRDFDIEMRFEIAEGGDMLSSFYGRTVRPGSAGYEQNRDFLEAHWDALAEDRREGIDRAWLPVVLRLLDRHGCRLADVWAEREETHALLRSVAGEPKFHAAENRLRMADVDWAMVRRWVEEGQRRSPHTRLEVYEGLVPESMIDDFAAQRSILLNTIPFDDLDHGEIVITADMVRENAARLEATQTRLITVLTREPDGTMSSMTDVGWCEHLPSRLVQRFTGVRPDARGRGIGKWIKAAMLEKLRAEYPQAEWMVTGNAESNGPMLSINHRLGFKQHRAGAQYQLTRERLAEVVAGL